MAAGDVVVLVGEDPVHELGPRPRHGHRHGRTRAQHPGQLGHRCDVVGDVLEHLGGDDPVEGPVGERQVESVALDCPHPGALGIELAGVGHGPEGVTHPGHLVVAGVEGDDLGPPACCLEGVAAEAAPEVEQSVAGPQAQPVVVDGQHQSAPPGAMALGAPGSGRPASTAS